MNLTVVGCSGSVPGPDSPASCYLVQAGGTSIVLDLGSGALGPLQRHVELDAVDAVLLSHLHPDHYMDLCGYYVALRYGPWRGCDRIPVWGPPGAAERIARAYGVPADPGMSGEFDFRAYPEASFKIGEVQVTAARMPHRGETDSDGAAAFAIRLEHGGVSSAGGPPGPSARSSSAGARDISPSVLVYSGDTGPSAALNELAAGADLLLCEAAFPDGEPHPLNLHLTGREAGEAAAAAGARQLMLTHIPPWGDPARARAAASSAFDGPIAVARPGAIVELGRRR
jgi:ribonuclease BN (tRNA processing enzyme)